MGIWVCDVRHFPGVISGDGFYVAYQSMLIGSNPITPTIPPNKCWDHVTRLKQKSNIELNFLSWCFSGGGTPVLIPNTEVKPSIAEGTAQVGDQVGANLKHLILL